MAKLPGAGGLRAPASVKSGARRQIWPAVVLIVLAFAVFLSEFIFEVSGSMFEAVDKEQHYQAGRIFSALVFMIFYAALLARVFLYRGARLVRLLLWLPALLAGALVLAIGAALLLAMLKESVDMAGLGHVEMEDILWTVRGALTMVAPVGVILIATPALIPMSALSGAETPVDKSSGIDGVDAYVQVSSQAANVAEKPQVLLVEDDITCATVAMNFCRAIHLQCRHVTTIHEARQVLRMHQRNIRLLMLDNFVGVGPDGSNITGGEWVKELEGEYPKGKRTFKVVIISGHPEFLKEGQAHADLVLKKPWNPRDLIAFLKAEGVLSAQGKGTAS